MDSYRRAQGEGSTLSTWRLLFETLRPAPQALFSNQSLSLIRQGHVAKYWACMLCIIGLLFQ
jgi:hypothetical protein